MKTMTPSELSAFHRGIREALHVLGQADHNVAESLGHYSGERFVLIDETQKLLSVLHGTAPPKHRGLPPWMQNPEAKSIEEV